MSYPAPSQRAAQAVADNIERVRNLMHKALETAADHLVLAALRHGNARAIVLPEDEYQAFMTTLEVEEDAEAVADLAAGADETRRDLPPNWDQLEDELGPLGTPQTNKAV